MQHPERCELCCSGGGWAEACAGQGEGPPCSKGPANHHQAKGGRPAEICRPMPRTIRMAVSTSPSTASASLSTTSRHACGRSSSARARHNGSLSQVQQRLCSNGMKPRPPPFLRLHNGGQSSSAHNMSKPVSASTHTTGALAIPVHECRRCFTEWPQRQAGSFMNAGGAANKKHMLRQPVGLTSAPRAPP